ncbi:hypothetical protein ACFXKJ_41935, partial [Kitasatospora indigofera]
SSADHLYAKSAATTWLLSQGQQASIRYGEPLGSVVDITWGRQDSGLRLHLDETVSPVWDDEAVEPVLGLSVPVDDETLVRRWYVHRVRFDSVGTARQVRIGTEAFARETEWFSLDDCRMTPEGFRTPAVERIIHARRTRTPSGPWRPPKPEPKQSSPKQPNPARRLEAALESGSRSAVESLCREMEAAGLHKGPNAEHMITALEQARAWLIQQAELREEMFDELRQAIQREEPDPVRTLLRRVEARAGREHSAEEHATTERAALLLKRLDDRKSQDARSGRVGVTDTHGTRHGTPEPRRHKAADPAGAAHQRMKDILGDLRRLGRHLSPKEIRLL